jgi:hypothetical protein
MTTMHDMDGTAFAPRAEDATEAQAWASSPLGDPTDPPEAPACASDFATDRITHEAARKSIDKRWVATGLIGVIGAGVALGIALFTGSPQPRSVAVTSGATAAPAAAPAPAAPAPDNGPGPAAVAPPPDNAASPADPGTPPASPTGPAVVNAPPRPLVRVPAPQPQLPPPPSLPLPNLPPLPLPLKLPPLPPPPALCLPPHHLVQGVCK